ncbi:hypothetical protein [uncultured Algibacter sp.]|uniref:hypothetical protein n=1 Tax=uncultured Algibacter sp. TaxID=298659 RepID=UPI002614F0A7|nr:hypothetical protein [uncultured Algibacter sp.]
MAFLLFLLSIGFFIIGYIWKESCKKYEFNNRTSGGTVDFESYSKSKRHGIKKYWAGAMIHFGKVSLLFAILAGIYGFFSPKKGPGKFEQKMINLFFPEKDSIYHSKQGENWLLTKYQGKEKEWRNLLADSLEIKNEQNLVLFSDLIDETTKYGDYDIEKIESLGDMYFRRTFKDTKINLDLLREAKRVIELGEKYISFEATLHRSKPGENWVIEKYLNDNKNWKSRLAVELPIPLHSLEEILKPRRKYKYSFWESKNKLLIELNKISIQELREAQRVLDGEVKYPYE